MPLSEHEERMLAEIERQLEEDDPRFMARARRRVGPEAASRRLRWAAAGFVVGVLTLLGLTFHIAFGVAGFALMLASVVVGATALTGPGGSPAARLRERFRDGFSDRDQSV